MASTNPIKLLVVEDCEADRELYRRLLRQGTTSRYVFIETSSKESALSLYRQHRPDCVLIDYNLPGFTGVELLKELKGIHPNDPIATLIFSAGGDERVAAAAIKAGACDYLCKDLLNKDSILASIQNAIATTRQEYLVKSKDHSTLQALESSNQLCKARTEHVEALSREMQAPINTVLRILRQLPEGISGQALVDYLNLAVSSVDRVRGLNDRLLLLFGGQGDKDNKLTEDAGQHQQAKSDHNRTEGSLSILVAEDNIMNQRLIRTILERRGHKVVLANNGEEVLSRLGSSNFDLILLDMQMPLLDGVATTQRIRAQEGGSRRRIPIVAVTANSQRWNRERCIAQGMDAYITKPFRQQELLQAISDILP